MVYDPPPPPLPSIPFPPGHKFLFFGIIKELFHRTKRSASTCNIRRRFLSCFVIELWTLLFSFKSQIKIVEFCMYIHIWRKNHFYGIDTSLVSTASTPPWSVFYHQDKLFQLNILSSALPPLPLFPLPRNNPPPTRICMKKAETVGNNLGPVLLVTSEMFV